jgi:site-specific DNA recombinase
MSAAQISELVEELGGLSTVLGEATGAERAQVYASLGLRLDYDPHLRRVKATADLSRVAGKVRGGLEPPQSYLVRALKVALGAEKHDCD